MLCVLGMNVVLQINSFVFLNRNNFKDEKLYNYIWKILDPDCQCMDDTSRSLLKVPVSIICYSRMVVAESSATLLAIHRYWARRELFVAKVSRKSKSKQNPMQPPSNSTLSVDISLLRQCIGVVLSDCSSKRNFMETYERDGHINHSIQATIMEEYNHRQRDLFHKMFGQSQFPEDHLNGFNNLYLKTVLNNDHYNLFVERLQEYYDLCLEVSRVHEEKGDRQRVPTSLMSDVKVLIRRWYLHDNILMSRKEYSKLKCPTFDEELFMKDLKHLLEKEMSPYFHNVDIFLSLLEKGSKEELGCHLLECTNYRRHDSLRCFDVSVWNENCHKENDYKDIVRMLMARLIDPTETYQGPRLLLPPSWNKMVSSVVVDSSPASLLPKYSPLNFFFLEILLALCICIPEICINEETARG